MHSVVCGVTAYVTVMVDSACGCCVPVSYFRVFCYGLSRFILREDMVEVTTQTVQDASTDLSLTTGTPDTARTRVPAARCDGQNAW